MTDTTPTPNPDQPNLDADVQTLSSFVDDVEAEVAALKAQVASNPSSSVAMIDFTGLDNLVAKVKGLDPGPQPSPSPATVTTPPVVPPESTTTPPAV